MELKRITISIKEVANLTDAQLDELLDLIEKELYRIGFEEDIQRVISRAKLSHGVKVEIDY